MEAKGGALRGEGAQLRPRGPLGVLLYLREEEHRLRAYQLPCVLSSITFSPCYCHCLVLGEQEGLEGRG